MYVEVAPDETRIYRGWGFSDTPLEQVRRRFETWVSSLFADTKWVINAQPSLSTEAWLDEHGLNSPAIESKVTKPTR